MFGLPGLLIAQTDSSHQGTIRIVKQKKKECFVKAKAQFDIRGKDSFQPFPVVEGYSFPFNYSVFLQEHLRKNLPPLKSSGTDTVVIEVRVTKKGKAIIRDLTSSRTLILNEDDRTRLDLIYKNCFSALAGISEWYPAYYITQEVGKLKGTTVIKPHKNNVESVGLITVYVSSEFFDE